MKRKTTASDPATGLYQAFDLLVSLVAVVDARGVIAYANSSFEDLVGSSRRSLVGSHIQDHVVQRGPLDDALLGVTRNSFAALRYDDGLRRVGTDAIPVHVVVAQTERPDAIVVEMLPIEQQTRQDRESRLLDQSAINRELVRNLAHEIKNPLGGIRGAAQLLQMEVESRELTEYTQVIIHEADRLQSLVDRLLAPHRKPHVVGDVNVHEVCERVRSVILAEFPRGLRVERDYDVSIPEFRGDREQLIQAVLNIAHNAAHALSDRIAAGDAELMFRTRITRQVTIGKDRYRLALELHVIDNGPGVPDSIRDRIFMPLVSGRDGGSGLGLTLAQTFVQQHHGVIEFESQPGKTDFMLLLPLP